MCYGHLTLGREVKTHRASIQGVKSSIQKLKVATNCHIGSLKNCSKRTWQDEMASNVGENRKGKAFFSITEI